MNGFGSFGSTYYTTLSFTAPNGEPFEIRPNEKKEIKLDHGLTLITEFWVGGGHSLEFESAFRSRTRRTTVVDLHFEVKVKNKHNEIIFSGQEMVTFTLNPGREEREKKTIPSKVFEALENLNMKAYKLMWSVQLFYWVYDFLMNGNERPLIEGVRSDA